MHSEEKLMQLSLDAVIEALGAVAIPTMIVFWLLNYVITRLDDIKSYQKELAEILTKILCVVEEGRK
jgi:hypothetical protein